MPCQMLCVNLHCLLTIVYDPLRTPTPVIVCVLAAASYRTPYWFLYKRGMGHLSAIPILSMGHCSSQLLHHGNTPDRDNSNYTAHPWPVTTRTESNINANIFTKGVVLFSLPHPLLPLFHEPSTPHSHHRPTHLARWRLGDRHPPGVILLL